MERFLLIFFVGEIFYIVIKTATKMILTDLLLPHWPANFFVPSNVRADMLNKSAVNFRAGKSVGKKNILPGWMNCASFSSARDRVSE